MNDRAQDPRGALLAVEIGSLDGYRVGTLPLLSERAGGSKRLPGPFFAGIKVSRDPTYEASLLTPLPGGN